MNARPMNAGDLDQITVLENELFTSPWKRSDFEYELSGNPCSHLLVIEEKGRILAYCDWWILYEQSQIATIGVTGAYQHQGLGQQMMDAIIRSSIDLGCETVSLEVRVSNARAIAFYEKNGFITVNTRKDYYTDNHEDAYLMVKPIGGMK